MTDKWQPIETAPEEYMFKADLWVPGEGRLTDCTYSTAFDPPQWCKRRFGEVYAVRKVKPTHWMALPPPPEKTNE